MEGVNQQRKGVGSEREKKRKEGGVFIIKEVKKEIEEIQTVTGKSIFSTLDSTRV